MSKVTVEPLVGPYELGEGPHWDDVSQKLYFVDIYPQKIYRYDPETRTSTSTYVENGPVGFVVPVAGTTDKFIAGSGVEFVLATWNPETSTAKCTAQTLAIADNGSAETRLNDGKADAAGRVWGGSMSSNVIDEDYPLDKGSLYLFDNALVLKKQVSPVALSNGLAWTSNNDTMYYIDSFTYQVVAYDFNLQTGDLSNKRTVFDLKKNKIPGIPDGMTIDTDENLWIALYGGGGVLQVNPKTGELLRYIKINGSNNITSVAFGGPTFDTLYVTSASTGLSENELKEQPYAGYLFAVKGLGVRGFPANTFKPQVKLT